MPERHAPERPRYETRAGKASKLYLSSISQCPRPGLVLAQECPRFCILFRMVLPQLKAEERIKVRRQAESQIPEAIFGSFEPSRSPKWAFWTVNICRIAPVSALYSVTCRVKFEQNGGTPPPPYCETVSIVSIKPRIGPSKDCEIPGLAFAIALKAIHLFRNIALSDRFASKSDGENGISLRPGRWRDKWRGARDSY
jgi:hypothetical protein